jgi:hypothetical protein
MAPKVIRKNCLRCDGSFLTYQEDKVYCNEDCRTKHFYEARFGKLKEKTEKRCLHCGIKMNCFENKSYCDIECRKKAVSVQESKENIPISNLKKRKMVKGLSLEERIRRNEYGRLYDDFHINRIIRGKS